MLEMLLILFYYYGITIIALVCCIVYYNKIKDSNPAYNNYGKQSVGERSFVFAFQSLAFITSVELVAPLCGIIIARGKLFIQVYHYFLVHCLILFKKMEKF